MVKVILIIFILGITACKQDQKDNEDSFSKRSGFQIICNEFFKFTHVYTTSLQSLPALASLFTGLYPYSHNVRTNSDSFLTPDFTTIAELAKKKGFKTQFLSGGAPFFRKSGLHQGFDSFDDYINSEKEYRPLKENIPTLLNNLADNDNHFLGVIHVSDLKYPHKVTTDELGEIRNLSLESQLEELDEKLFLLFSKLKNEKFWDHTRILILGLNGYPNLDFNLENPQLSLKSDNTQIGFFFKEMKKNAVNSKPQSINKTLSIKDIGQFLINSFSESTTSVNFKNFDNELFFSNSTPSNNEFIVVETAWAKFHEIGEIRTAIIDDNTLFIFDENRLIFNKLSDSNEQYPQPINSQLRDKIVGYENYLINKNFSPFKFTLNIKNFLDEINLLKKGDFSKDKKSEVYDYFTAFFLNEKKDLHGLLNLMNKYFPVKDDKCLSQFFKNKSDPDFISLCNNVLAKLVFYGDSLEKFPEKLNDKDLKLFLQNEISNFNITKMHHRNNLRQNLDYYKVQSFKIDTFKYPLLYFR
ncbi:MAG: sulfatase-like hydrolase/transferase [Bdellovibrionaceae bacterium]|nr:sulfatase-like hydrolase/transferase [Pseudobdellovibrionaceae bacterium]